ncbi:MAG: peptidoglycan-associated lipoprotein Pal [Nitrospirae bacterium]|nr:peptidoglycan-associated lipoprotein Pal [Nitrospirota bacterium]
MKKIFSVSILLIACIVLIAGCAQRKVVSTPEQPQAGATANGKQKEGAVAKDLSREAITEKELAKSRQTDIQSTAKELKSNIQNIYFDFDRFDIRDDAKPVLKELAAMLSKNTKARLVIEGHCDERGTGEYNLALGEKRAGSTKTYLATLGIPSSRIETISYGKEKPVCTESTEACWAKNRRAHFVLNE